MILTGKKGEQDAALYLKNKGYKIIEKNWRFRGGEIDIIASDNDIIVFIEVKTRRSTRKGKPYESVNFLKLIHIKRAIYSYIKKHNLFNKKLRFDIISIEHKDGENIISHYENVELPSRS